jgi:hypothetical protein
MFFPRRGWENFPDMGSQRMFNGEFFSEGFPRNQNQYPDCARREKISEYSM